MDPEEAKKQDTDYGISFFCVCVFVQNSEKKTLKTLAKCKQMFRTDSQLLDKDCAVTIPEECY